MKDFNSKFTQYESQNNGLQKSAILVLSANLLILQRIALRSHSYLVFFLVQITQKSQYLQLKIDFHVALLRAASHQIRKRSLDSTINMFHNQLQINNLISISRKIRKN